MMPTPLPFLPSFPPSFSSQFPLSPDRRTDRPTASRYIVVRHRQTAVRRRRAASQVPRATKEGRVIFIFTSSALKNERCNRTDTQDCKERWGAKGGRGLPEDCLKLTPLPSSLPLFLYSFFHLSPLSSVLSSTLSQGWDNSWNYL